MPITKSAKKALRQSARKRKMNVSRSVALKKAIKELKKISQSKDKDALKAALDKVYKLADKTVKTKYIKKNKASRIKSRAAKLVAKSLS
ncbi:MAG: 30S ribosomal protein S20 [Candidatus Paceibacterota bacterium]|jgi:small subunit ribosomal protein S20